MAYIREYPIAPFDMHTREGRDLSSIRAKATLFAVLEIVVTVATVVVIAVFSLTSYGNYVSNRVLELLCETGKRDLNGYFDSVEQSVATVSGYATSDLAKTDLSDMDAHLERVAELFEKVAYNTHGVLTYYYRTDPTVTSEPGFWFVYTERYGFIPHTPTDITAYDLDDQNSLVWFTVPRATGSAVWLAPYVTDNLDVYVLSYNVPIYKGNTFVGVIGIEIDYSTLAKSVDNLTLAQHGYAFVSDAEGRLVYHPHIDVPSLPEGKKPKVPEGLDTGDTHTSYTYHGVEKQAVCASLDNGMRLVVSVPVAEVNRGWQLLVNRIIIVSLVLLVLAALLTRRFMSRLTDPLRDLTKAAEQLDEGNYDVELTYDKKNEVGALTSTVRRLVGHLKIHMEELNSLAYADSLTHVRNKGAFDLYARDLQEEIDDGAMPPEFAIGVFDCDYLKVINDQYGHDKGDAYITIACKLICEVFSHSPVFRIGGDEFAMILQGTDYRERDQLASEFEVRRAAQCASTDVKWEQVSVSFGIAVYDPTSDESVGDVTRRADKLMYEAKRRRGAARLTNGQEAQPTSPDVDR